MRLAPLLTSRAFSIAALPVALVATAGIVAASSYSVFTSATSSPTNSFSAGSVVLKNDSASSTGAQSQTGSALFTVSNISPTSAAVVKCITVQSSGSLASAVKLYTQNTTTTNSLATYLTITVEMGSATNTNGGSCSTFSSASTLAAAGPLSTFESNYPGYSSGLATWSPTGSGTESKAFRITVAPNGSMTNTQQGGTAQLDFVWEADNS